MKRFPSEDIRPVHTRPETQEQTTKPSEISLRRDVQNRLHMCTGNSQICFLFWWSALISGAR